MIEKACHVQLRGSREHAFGWSGTWDFPMRTYINVYKYLLCVRMTLEFVWGLIR